MHPLDKQLMHRINRLSHLAALDHEKHVKNLLTARLLKLRDDGACDAELERALDGLEASQMDEGISPPI